MKTKLVARFLAALAGSMTALASVYVPTNANAEDADAVMARSIENSEAELMRTYTTPGGPQDSVVIRTDIDANSVFGRAGGVSALSHPGAIIGTSGYTQPLRSNVNADLSAMGRH